MNNIKITLHRTSRMWLWEIRNGATLIEVGSHANFYGAIEAAYSAYHRAVEASL